MNHIKSIGYSSGGVFIKGVHIKRLSSFPFHSFPLSDLMMEKKSTQLALFNNNSSNKICDQILTNDLQMNFIRNLLGKK